MTCSNSFNGIQTQLEQQKAYDFAGCSRWSSKSVGLEITDDWEKKVAPIIGCFNLWPLATQRQPIKQELSHLPVVQPCRVLKWIVKYSITEKSQFRKQRNPISWVTFAIAKQNNSIFLMAEFAISFTIEFQPDFQALFTTLPPWLF